MHILVIEDNPDLVANLYDFLEPRGYVVDAAYDAGNGLRLARSDDYDAIILDLMLPGMDGLEVCSRLKDSGSNTPVLMLTARDMLDDKLEGFARGADDYLVKPFAMQELDARLKAIIRRVRGEQSREPLKVADLKFNPATLHVERGGKSISLSPIPLKILTLLIRQSPRVVPRREIERRVWGNTRPDSDALRAHMSVLRAAIDRPFDRCLLRTVHGIGYQLVAPDENQD
ncbi:MAG TPA: response regulator transcription factor [Acidiferrobacteraceae bacterium]|nr:response regulator transcription factor [Acidiferrobacteraceae bacterium]